MTERILFLIHRMYMKGIDISKYKHLVSEKDFRKEWNTPYVPEEVMLDIPDMNDSGDESGKDSGKESGDESGKDSGDESGKDSGDESGKDSGDESGKDSGKESGDESGDDTKGGKKGGKKGGDKGGKKPKSTKKCRVWLCSKLNTLLDALDHVEEHMDKEKKE